MISVTTEEHLKAKLERAGQHILDLQDKWANFSRDGYRVEFKDDPHTRQRIYYLADVRNIDVNFSLMIGDGVHCLRSALDHLAYHVMSVSPGVTVEELKGTYFPIAENAVKYRTKRDRIKGMRQDALRVIDDIEPFGGGAGEVLWHLHLLDIIDKHRLLIAVGSTSRHHSMTPHQITDLKRNFLGIGLDAYTPAQDAIVFQTGSANVQFPLKTDDVLAVIPEDEVHEHMHFSFEIAFGGPKVLEGKPVISTLHQMAERILNIVRTFIYDGMVG